MEPKYVEEKSKQAHNSPAQTPRVEGIGRRDSEPDAKSILRFRLDYFTANITRRLVDIQRMRESLEYCSENEASMLLHGLDSRVFDGSIERL